MITAKELSPEQEQQLADKFLRQCMMHISNASDSQKKILLRTMLERPVGGLTTVAQAEAIWSGLTQDEIMKLIPTIQKQFDKETWEFISRWRK